MSWKGDRIRHRLALHGIRTGQQSNPLAFYKSHGFSPKWIQQNMPKKPQQLSLETILIRTLRPPVLNASRLRPPPSFKLQLRHEQTSAQMGLNHGLPYASVQHKFSPKTTGTAEVNVIEGPRAELEHTITKKISVTAGITATHGPYVGAQAEIGPVKVGVQINREKAISGTVRLANSE